MERPETAILDRASRNQPVLRRIAGVALMLPMLAMGAWAPALAQSYGGAFTDPTLDSQPSSSLLPAGSLRLDGSPTDMSHGFTQGGAPADGLGDFGLQIYGSGVPADPAPTDDGSSPAPMTDSVTQPAR
ncbi:MAG TPA: hypothetical protein VGO34_08515 [Alphaproteobacteria bacterium]|jgi:hypothetical protein